MKTQIITTEQELIAIKDSWNDLVRNNPETNAPFFSWDWFYHSWLHFGKPSHWELSVVTVAEGLRVVGILPLVRWVSKSCGVSYRLLGFCDVGMLPRNMIYFDVLSDCELVFREIWAKLFLDKSSWDMIELVNIPELSRFHKFCLDPKNLVRSALIRRQGFNAPIIELGGTLDDYFEMLDSKARKDLRRRMRKFKDYGDAKNLRFFEKREEIDEGLQMLFEVHRRSWKGEFSNPHYIDFYKEITAVLSERGEVIIAAAILNTKPISAGYILTNNDTYFSLINDHDTQFRELAPGMILFVHELDYLIKSGKKKFDFCGTTYDYKERLSNNNINHSTFQIFHNGFKSRFIYSAKTFWLPCIRKILRKQEPNDLIEKIEYQ
ncbi:MAG: GNAT family N-acetyltransferase [Planctomycetaceae bacterium]|jgi:CelD/BcsL family acetyltransferase involved in cellulose biosynthesis|nr:GNAT family N-acetyltransferase [Planctomycetaceae bacterium]